MSLLQRATGTTGLTEEARDAEAFDTGAVSHGKTALRHAIQQSTFAFQPATHFDISADMANDLAVGYVVTDGQADATVPMGEVRQGRGYRVPTGGIITTIDDLSRSLAFQFGNGPESVLSHAGLDISYAGVIATPAEEEFGYGVGFILQHRGDFPWLGQSGDVPGYQAGLSFDRDHRVGVILLRNATGGRASINRLGPDMLRALILAQIGAARTSR